MSDLITVAMGEMHMVFEDQVVKAVQDVGIHVNKEELLQALELSKKLVRCEECKYESVCSRGVQHTTHEPTSVTIGWKNVEWCSYGERKGE